MNEDLSYSVSTHRSFINSEFSRIYLSINMICQKVCQNSKFGIGNFKNHLLIRIKVTGYTVHILFIKINMQYKSTIKVIYLLYNFLSTIIAFKTLPYLLPECFVYCSRNLSRSKIAEQKLKCCYLFR